MKLQGNVESAEDLGQMLQQGRLLSGLSQRELAERLGTSQRYIWEIESGKPSIFTDRIFAFMRATGVHLIAEMNDDRDGN